MKNIKKNSLMNSTAAESQRSERGLLSVARDRYVYNNSIHHHYDSHDATALFTSASKRKLSHHLPEKFSFQFSFGIAFDSHSPILCDARDETTKEGITCCDGNTRKN